MDKYQVTQTTEECNDLEHLVSAGKATVRQLTHPCIETGVPGRARPRAEVLSPEGLSDSSPGFVPEINGKWLLLPPSRGQTPLRHKDAPLRFS